MKRIELEDMTFYAYHGCYEEERIIGTHFLVTLVLDYPGDQAAKTDQIEDALNYVEAYERVQSVMKQPAHLLEHLATQILDDLFQTFPQLVAARVKVSKMNPPLGGKTKCVSISDERRREAIG